MAADLNRDEWIRKIGKEIFCARCRQLTPTSPVDTHENGIIIACVHCGHRNIVLPRD
jgi:DNA-directed RNA polymerase subunit RPC12/RpoP